MVKSVQVVVGGKIVAKHGGTGKTCRLNIMIAQVVNYCIDFTAITDIPLSFSLWTIDSLTKKYEKGG